MDVCRRSAVGCSELPSKRIWEFSNTEIITYKTKTKIEFCWSETGLVIRPMSQTTSLLFHIGHIAPCSIVMLPQFMCQLFKHNFIK